MKKIIILSLLSINFVLGQSITISPNVSAINSVGIIQTLTNRLGLEHTDGTIQLNTYVNSNLDNNLGGWLQTTTAHPLIFSTSNGAPQMVLNNSGNIMMEKQEKLASDC
jgi:hypothetical protein